MQKAADKKHGKEIAIIKKAWPIKEDKKLP
jgi:hypothetical protein